MMNERIIDDSMNLAILDAKSSIGFVQPNPAVGSVILNSFGEIIGRGHHEVFGGPHAEVKAVNSVQDKSQLKDATLIVTLEPCSHFGKTPPCVDLIIKNKIKNVIVGLVDPNPIVSGRGIEKLKEAGVQVTLYKGKYLNKLEELTEIFFLNQIKKRPFVSIKAAVTLDGAISDKHGNSKWITTEKSREYVHTLRGEYSSILVGRNTIEKDLPQLNIRTGPYKNKSNKVIILDKNNALDGHHGIKKLMETRDSQDILRVISKDYQNKISHSKLNEQMIFVSIKDNDFNLVELLSSIYSNGVNSIMIEGGSYTYSSFLKSKLVDKLHLFIAPKILGALSGVSWTSNLNLGQFKNLINLSHVNYELIDQDIYLSGKPVF